MTAEEVEKLAISYATAFSGGGEHSAGEEWDKVCLLIADDPGAAWEVLTIAIDRINDDVGRSMIGAGQLEELLVKYPERFVSRAAERAVANTAFRRALSHADLRPLPVRFLSAVADAVRKRPTE